jgi:hypothetical protein
LPLGYYYNEALIVPERNNHGLVTCVELRDQQYPNLYLDVSEGSIEPDRETLNIGVFTSEKTKPLMIDKLRAFDRNREIEINDTNARRDAHLCGDRERQDGSRRRTHTMTV